MPNNSPRPFSSIKPGSNPSPAVRADVEYLQLALRLARRGLGRTSPNPMVGAVLVKAGRVLGRGWHRKAGEAHAEIEALNDAGRHGLSPKGATLYVTLEPCCTQGRTPPCTDAIIAAGIKRVVVGATDPNPRHCGKAFPILEAAGIRVSHGLLGSECTELNESFNHWIVHRTPLVTVKAAMTLDGKIATRTGQSKWITGERARTYAMELRHRADAILVGINTVLQDDPSLTARARPGRKGSAGSKALRRIVLDANARTPTQAKIVSDSQAALTTIVVGKEAPQARVAALAKRVQVLTAPVEVNRGGSRVARLDLAWVLRKLGAENVTNLLVEGGGEVNASFLLQGLAQRIAFFYAPMILGGGEARKAVAGTGAEALAETLQLSELNWRRLGADWLLTAKVLPRT